MRSTETVTQAALLSCGASTSREVDNFALDPGGVSAFLPPQTRGVRRVEAGKTKCWRLHWSPFHPAVAQVFV